MLGPAMPLISLASYYFLANTGLISGRLPRRRRRHHRHFSGERGRGDGYREARIRPQR